jgi:hypothetical protein
LVILPGSSPHLDARRRIGKDSSRTKKQHSLETIAGRGETSTTS